MKFYSFLFVLLLTASETTYGQMNDSASRQERYYYYHTKVKNQSIAALVLVGTGVVVTTYSTIQVANNLFNEKVMLPPWAYWWGSEWNSADWYLQLLREKVGIKQNGFRHL